MTKRFAIASSVFFFTKIYLDRYFRDADKLLTDLNASAARFNVGDSSGLCKLCEQQSDKDSFGQHVFIIPFAPTQAFLSKDRIRSEQSPPEINNTQTRRSTAPQKVPQYSEVPPNIVGKHIT